MKRHLKINYNLYLVQEDVKTIENQEEPKQTNHIFIYDRSQSMYYLLSQLIEDLIEKCRQIPKNDTISIGWFSTEGKYNFILKGFKITDTSDYSILEKAIRNNNCTIGLTCFSEILTETAEVVIKDLSIFSNRFALVFFTDGYPVVSNYNKEIECIFSAINLLEKVITSSLFVGYGNYYNKDLMVKMTEKIGGSLVHSSDLSSFKITFSDYIKSVSKSDNRIKLEISNENDIHFGINESNINVYTPNNKIINFLPVKRGKNFIYILTKNEPKNSEEVKLTDGQVGKNSKIEAFVKAVYASAYIYLQRTKVQDALDILSLLGDKFVLESIINAFTNEEYGKSEHIILDCIKSYNKRFIKGRDTNYLPPKDAFCLLDFINLLCNDDNAYFYPRHYAFKYNKIGLPSVPQEGYPKFEANPNVKCKFSNLVWNNTRLNLSILARLDGTIELPRGRKKYGFDNKKFNTYVWRNYTIVKDGFLNTLMLPISTSSEVYQELKAMDLIHAEYDNNIYLINLTKLPIINRKISEENTSAKELFKLAFESLEQKAELKTYKFLKNELNPEKQINIFDGYNEEQVAYLATQGVTDKGFNPPMESIISTDYYYAKEFKINIIKYSSLPKIEDVRNKIDKGKNLTASDTLIEAALNKYNLIKIDKKEWLDDEIKKLTKLNKIIDHKIQKIKFAIILGNQWFKEFNNWSECTMTINGIDYLIKFKDKKIEI